MKLIIAGSGTLGYRVEPTFIEDILVELRLAKPSEIVSSGMSGIDTLAERYANIKKINVKSFYPNSYTYGNSSDPFKNRQMAEYADALLLIWDESSLGCMHLKQEVKKQSKPVYEVIIRLPK